MIASRLSALRIRFLDVLETRLNEVEALRDALEAGGLPQAVREDHVRAICFAAHKTVGVAATLGFADLGMLSQRVELAATDHLEHREPPTTPRMVVALTDDMLGEMALILAQAGR
ncbi:Hpt domain-containing protein [Frigidibacter sp.]|uniref:Hpt domain-containing protein n=1 Tax=Frigidibacter sp. TaxID=2586418 RepID=UPI00273618E9|nr:Hpt domain-containing protein [Frigidibacter sp.]